MLRRAGLHEVSTAIESHFKEKPSQFSQVSLNYLLNLPPSKYDSIGIFNENAKSLRTFIDWWNKTPADARRIKLAFINYFDSPHDQRSIEQCVRASEGKLMSYFLKAYPNNKARVTSAIKALTLSRYPHSERQILHFLKKYSGKPSLAQDRISELVDIPTLHSEDLQAKVLDAYFLAANRLQLLFKNYRILSLSEVIIRSLNSANAIINRQGNR